MNSNEYDPSTADDDVLTNSTLDTHLTWAYADYGSLPHSHWNDTHLNNWNGSTLQGPPMNHRSLPLVPSQVQTWNHPGQEHANNQYIHTSASCAPQPGASTTMMTPYGSYVSPYIVGGPAVDDLGAYQSTNTTQSRTLSRKPSHYSDPGIWTASQDETFCQLPTDFSPPTNPETVSSTRADTNTTERTNTSSSGPSPAQGQRIRCFDHGCNGRTFSSVSNLRRHQRERAGRTPISFCPWCGAAFYRRWTRDHHVTRMSCLRIPR